MRLNETNKLSSAVRLALTLGSAATFGAVGTAQAQNANPDSGNAKSQNLETIVVTGSNIRRVDLETSNPVVTLDRAAIQETGKLTLGDLLQSLPAAFGPQTNPQVNNGGGGGTSTIGLRGLGANRTLVLVDGHRINKTALGGVNDVNSIPISMIERVEVLSDGAAAIYGSDAIGGVVNFITRKNYQGAELSVDWGESDKDDGLRKGFHFVFGQSTDKGSIVAGIDYNKQDAIFQGNRGFSAVSTSISASSSGNGLGKPGAITPAPGGSSTGIRGNIRLPTAVRNQLFPQCSGNLARTNGTDGTQLSDYHCYVTSGPNTDKYNYATVNYAVTPQERTNAFLNGTYHLTDSIDVYMLAYHNKTSANFDLAPLPVTTANGLVISSQSYYNPFGVEFSNAAKDSFGFRAVPLGLRGGANATTNDQISAGIKGHLDLVGRDWTWEVGMDYGHSSTTTAILGLANLNKVNPAFGPSYKDASGNIVCGTPGNPIAGCTPANPFNVNDATTDSVLRGALFTPINNFYGQTKTFRADFSGGLFDLPAGTMQLAFGGDYTKYYLNTRVDPALQEDPTNSYTCTAGSQCNASLQGGYNVKEAYAELFTPILKDMPFAKSLNLIVGTRYSKYSSPISANTNNWKVALEYKPIDDLLLRGTVSRVFRAPSISNLFAPPASNADKLSFDPCNLWTGINPKTGQPYPANSGPALACRGVPTDGTFINSDIAQNLQTSTILTGSQAANYNLQPEHGKSFSFGFVYDPTWLEGANVSVDFWRIYINNTIATVGVQTNLSLCYAGVTQYCQFVHRFDGQGDIAPSTQDITANLGRTDTKGVDLAARYRLPETSFGRFDFNLAATYLTQYKNDAAPGLPGDLITNAAGHFLPFGSIGAGACPTPSGSVCLFPRWRANFAINWNLGNLSASLRTRYIGRFTMGSSDPQAYVYPIGGVNTNLGQSNSGQNYYPGYLFKYGATIYNDLSVGYNIESLNTRIDVGVDNLTDKKPPLLYANNTLNANSDPSDFDFIGRYYRARVTVKF